MSTITAPPRPLPPRALPVEPDHADGPEETTAPAAETPAPDAAPAVDISSVKTVDMSVSEKLSQDCIGSRVSFNWFATSKQVDKATKVKMANAADTSEDGFSASKKLMTSTHPMIKKANELRRRIEGAWKGCTIPFSAFGSAAGRPEPGVRLIEAVKYEELDRKMRAFVPEVQAIEAELNAALPDIKEMDRKRLKGNFSEDDYPAHISIDFSWGAIEVKVPAALEKLSPRVYQEATDALHRRMAETHTLARATILENFSAVVEGWLKALSPVVRIYPKPESAYVRFHGAEIRETFTSEDDASIPAGQKKVLLRYKKAEGRGPSEEALVGPLTAQEMADLQPSESANERRTFHATTIEGLNTFLAEFRNVHGMVGDQPELNQAIQAIEKQLARLPSTEGLVRELKDSPTFRQDTHKIMQQLDKTIVSQLEVVRRPTRTVTRNFEA